jgi:WD40 repeat protein
VTIGYCPTPRWEFDGHGHDILDLAWSKNNFILSSSMDATVRLWHLSTTKCLRIFVHDDFVTAVDLGLGRIVALHHRSSTLYHIH